MELNLSPELEGKLAVAADRRGLSVEALAREALERAVDYEDWFLREVETGLAEIDAGETLTHDAVGTRLAKKLGEHESRASSRQVDLRRTRDAVVIPAARAPEPSAKTMSAGQGIDFGTRAPLLGRSRS